MQHQHPYTQTLPCGHGRILLSEPSILQMPGFLDAQREPTNKSLCSLVKRLTKQNNPIHHQHQS